DVVVESADAVPVFLEEPECVVVGKIFELDERMREHAGGGRDELVNEVIVNRAGHAVLMQAEVKRIVQQGLVVGTGVEHGGETLRGMNPGASGVKGELADRD